MKISKYWIEYYTPGSFTSDTWIVDCDENTKPEDVEWPDNAYAFSMLKRNDIIEDDNTYKGEVKKLGFYYHPDSKIETLEEAKLNPSSTNILIRNMECNKWDRIIWTRWGNWPQQFTNNDIVL